MTQREAAHLLGLAEDADAGAINAAYAQQRARLEEKAERAATENLRAKYHAAVADLERARDAALDSGRSARDTLPVVRRSEPKADPAPATPLSGAGHAAPEASSTKKATGQRPMVLITAIIVLLAAVGLVYYLQRPSAESQHLAAEDFARAEEFYRERFVLPSGTGEDLGLSTEELIAFGSQLAAKRGELEESARRARMAALERLARLPQLRAGSREHAQATVEAEALDRLAANHEKIARSGELEAAFREFTAARQANPQGPLPRERLERAVREWQSAAQQAAGLPAADTLLIVTSTPTGLEVEIESTYGRGHSLVITGRTPLMELGFFGQGQGRVRVRGPLATDKHFEVTLGGGASTPARFDATWP